VTKQIDMNAQVHAYAEDYHNAIRDGERPLEWDDSPHNPDNAEDNALDDFAGCVESPQAALEAAADAAQVALDAFMLVHEKIWTPDSRQKMTKLSIALRKLRMVIEERGNS